MNNNTGELQVNVFAENEGFPIFNAKVTITDRDSVKTIEELYTNATGRTEVIELPAPPVEYSLEYGNDKPYAEYNVFVEAEGFEKIAFLGVQIFSTSKAIQNARMQYTTGGEIPVQSILIKEPVLWGTFPPKIPEDDVKPLPESFGFVVLPDVVIPEYIVVHLGTPNNKSAGDVWVRYKDYIKNVACSEIYSTWPVETIKANVIAIISFTLNRVYTEWYYAKGYNFTVTNSTAYDQAFNFGRTIFRSISNVVDDVFSTYLTRPDIKQPLFTQYCDGERVKCPNWMTQWGSKDLGSRGFSASEILRRFYGYECYFDVAKTVKGVPHSFGGKVLTVGTSNEDVRIIQNQLNTISNNFPLIPKLPVTGYYGEQTQNAVKIFQGIFGLPETGNVDFATWYRISSIYVAVAKLAEL